MKSFSSICVASGIAAWLGGLVYSGGLAESRAEDWPGWRGPLRTGVTSDTGVPLTWSASQRVAWKTALPGSGISTPIILGNRVVVTAAEKSKPDELYVICLAADSGEPLWQLRLWGTAPTLHHATKGSMAAPSPISDGEHIYAFFGSGDVYCIDIGGGLEWHRSLASEYGPFENRFAPSSSPLLAGDLLILQCDHYGDSYVVAIDKHSGANRWKTDRPEAWLSWSSPQLTPPDNAGRQELILCGSEKLDALDPRTGDKLWTLTGLAHECIPTPVLGHGLIYAVSGPNGASYAIRPGGRGDVTLSHVVWSSRTGTPFVPSGILVGDYYYLVSDQGIGTCLDAHSGETVWRKRFGGNFTASPVSAEGRIYFVDEAGTTLVIEAGVAEYRELARNPLEAPVYASPAIAGGRIFLRTAAQLYCIGESRR